MIKKASVLVDSGIKIIITTMLLIMGGVESVVGLLQLIGISLCLHPDHMVSGHFYNSGPYACFLAVSFPLIFRLFVTAGNKGLQLVSVGLMLLYTISISTSLSRTAWIACCLGMLIASVDFWRSKLHSLTVKKLFLTWLSVLLLSIGAYHIKEASAHGRLLMWKIAMTAARNVPITGVGWDNVAGEYGEAQEWYFSSGESSETEVMVADAPEYVFNEYLQVAIAFGIPISTGMVLLITGGGIIAFKNRAYGYAGAVVAVAVVMLASYPLQFPLFIATTALIIIGAYLSTRNPWIKWSGITAIIILCSLFLSNNKTEDVRSAFATGHLLHRSGNYIKSNNVLLNLLPHSADPMILNIIGKNYQALGMPDSAEFYLIKSVNRCPNRLYPHYLLMNLYSDSASFNRCKAVQEAQILVTKKSKILSPAIDAMREDAYKILKLANE